MVTLLVTLAIILGVMVVATLYTIILLAIDPYVISKAIELKLNQMSSYLRKMVHLPFFLQNSGLSQSHSWYETEKFS